MASSTTVGAKKKKDVKLWNLDMEEDEEDGSEAEGGDEDIISTAETEALNNLKHILTACQVCGTEVHCKIGKGGKHVHLTHQQLCTWAVVLVRPTLSIFFLKLITRQATKMHKVTTKTPPTVPLFDAFHSTTSHNGANNMANPGTFYPEIPQNFGMNPFSAMSWMASMVAMQNSAQQTMFHQGGSGRHLDVSSPIRGHTAPSSDPH